jgi:hypothetical protein
MKSTEFLQAAIDVQAERGVAYDKPSGERSMGATVTAFNAITGRDLSEAEGWLLLQTLKDVRQWQNPSKYHHDSALDGVAYSALKAEALSEEKQQDHGWCGDDPRDELAETPWQEWKKGDIVGSMENGDDIKYGNNYILLDDPDENGDISFYDDDGCSRIRDADKYRFMWRPTSTTK